MVVVSQRLFPVIFVLLSLQCLCDQLEHEEEEPRERNHTVGGDTSGLRSYRSPYVLPMGDAMVTVSETWNSSEEEKYTDVITEYSDVHGDTVFTQVGVRNATLNFHAVYTHKEDRESTMHPTAVARNGKIFVLIFCKNISADDSHTGDAVIMPHVATGIVSSPGNLKATLVAWVNLTSVRPLLPRAIEGKRVSMFFGGSGNSIVTPKGALVMPVQMVRTDDRRFATVMYSSNDGATWSLGRGFTDEGCRESSVVLWKNKVLLVSRSDEGFTKVFESERVGDVWVESLGTISRVLGNSPDRTGSGNQGSAITIVLDGVPVLLLTQTTTSSSPGGGWGSTNRIDQRIWLSDGNRVVKVGHIYWQDRLSHSHSYLMYTNDTLLCAHELSVEKGVAVTVRQLTKELGSARSVVAAWVKQDKYILSVCPSEGNAVSPCVSGVPVVGLVGLLSSMLNENQWVDAYLSVNANVVGGVVSPMGMTFEGAIRGGRWPVGAQGQNQRYHFANTRFSLVLTLIIHEQTAARAPVFITRLYMDGEHVDLEFSYTGDRRWHMRYGSEHGSTAGEWALNEVHQLVFLVDKGVLGVYLDGKRMPTMVRTLIEGGKLLNITHFYIGGYGVDKESPNDKLTIRNVMLYNRPLNKMEIDNVFAARSGITAATTAPWVSTTNQNGVPANAGAEDDGESTSGVSCASVGPLCLVAFFLYSRFM